MDLQLETTPTQCQSASSPRGESSWSQENQCLGSKKQLLIPGYDMLWQNMTTSKVVVKPQWLYGFDAADANAVYVAACSHIALGPNPL